MRIIISIILISSIFAIFLVHKNQMLENTKHKILYVSSYNAETYVWVRDQEKGIKKAFKNSRIPIEYKVYYMDTKKYNTEKDKIERGLIAQNIIKDWNPDIIITGDENATLYVALPLKNTKYKFIFCGLNNDPKSYNLPASNITGIREKYDYYKDAIKILKMLNPKAKNIAVLNEKTETSEILVNNFKKSIENSHIHIFDIKETNSYEEWKKLVISYKTKIDALMIFVPFSIKDKNGDVVHVTKILDWTETHLNKPIIGIYSFTNVSTLVSVYGCGFSQGYMAADMAIDVLKGKKISDLKVKTAKDGVIYINANKAKKYKLKIPPILLESATIK